MDRDREAPRFALDLRWWHESLSQGRPNGISRYSAGLAEALVAASLPDDVVLVGSARGDPSFLDQWRARARVIDGPGTWLTSPLPWAAAVRRQAGIDRRLLVPALADCGVSVYHATSHFLPPPVDAPFRTVCTVLDFAYSRFPEIFLPRSWSRRAFEVLLDRTARADFLIAISEATARDAACILGVSRARIDVIPCGLEQSFVYERPSGDGKGGRPREHFLFVGGTRARAAPLKNLDGLLEAYRLLPAITKCAVPPLVVVGEAPAGSAPPDVRFAGRVDDATLLDLYRRAVAVVVPSQWEGFGYPVLEAMAQGTPVIASRVASIPEVAGDDAILVDPSDPRSIAVGMRRLIESPDLCAELSTRGRRRAEQFNWAGVAGRILSVYRKAAASSGRRSFGNLDQAAPEVHVPPDQEDYWTRYYASSRARSHIGRRRLLTVLESTGELEECSVLDIGCGDGKSTVAIALAGAAQPLGVDLSPDLPRRGPRIAAHNAAQARFVRGDATKLPLRDGGFEFVLSMEMLEHIPEWESALREMARCLKPGGRLLVSTPNKWGIHHIAKMLANRLRLHSWGHAYTYEKFLSRRQVLGALREAGLDRARVRTALFMMPFVPDRLFGPARAIERLLERIPWVRGLGVTNVYTAGKLA